MYSPVYQILTVRDPELQERETSAACIPSEKWKQVVFASLPHPPKNTLPVPITTTMLMLIFDVSHLL